MIKKTCLLIVSIIFINGCAVNSEPPPDIEFVSMHKNDSAYDMVFLSDTNFTMLKSLNIGSAIFCVASKEIYDKNFSQESAKTNSLIGVIPRDEKLETHQSTNKFIYKVKMGYLATPMKTENDTTFYCKVNTIKYMGNARTSKIFKAYL